jgi:hypothetical protein
VAKDLAEDLTSFKALKDYRLAGHVATAGPCGTWRIFLAISKKPGEGGRAGRAAGARLGGGGREASASNDASVQYATPPLQDERAWLST